MTSTDIKVTRMINFNSLQLRINDQVNSCSLNTEGIKLTTTNSIKLKQIQSVSNRTISTRKQAQTKLSKDLIENEKCSSYKLA